ncbi:hypothetical protein KL914_005216 [Ogataea haglerorum]|nr:hypothetical protein KL914_005216 [Ogataea haglerorum]
MESFPTLLTPQTDINSTSPAPVQIKDKKGRSTSCYLCQKRKQKCDQRSPSCTNCVKSQTTCVQPPRYGTSNKTNVKSETAVEVQENPAAGAHRRAPAVAEPVQGHTGQAVRRVLHGARREVRPLDAGRAEAQRIFQKRADFRHRPETLETACRHILCAAAVQVPDAQRAGPAQLPERLLQQRGAEGCGRLPLQLCKDVSGVHAELDAARDDGQVQGPGAAALLLGRAAPHPHVRERARHAEDRAAGADHVQPDPQRQGQQRRVRRRAAGDAAVHQAAAAQDQQLPERESCQARPADAAVLVLLSAREGHSDRHLQAVRPERAPDGRGPPDVRVRAVPRAAPEGQAFHQPDHQDSSHRGAVHRGAQYSREHLDHHQGPAACGRAVFPAAAGLAQRVPRLQQGHRERDSEHLLLPVCAEPDPAVSGAARPGGPSFQGVPGRRGPDLPEHQGVPPEDRARPLGHQHPHRIHRRGHADLLSVVAQKPRRYAPQAARRRQEAHAAGRVGGAVRRARRPARVLRVAVRDVRAHQVRALVSRDVRGADDRHDRQPDSAVRAGLVGGGAGAAERDAAGHGAQTAPALHRRVGAQHEADRRGSTRGGGAVAAARPAHEKHDPKGPEPPADPLAAAAAAGDVVAVEPAQHRQPVPSTADGVAAAGVASATAQSAATRKRVQPAAAVGTAAGRPNHAGAQHPRDDAVCRPDHSHDQQHLRLDGRERAADPADGAGDAAGRQQTGQRGVAAAGLRRVLRAARGPAVVAVAERPARRRGRFRVPALAAATSVHRATRSYINISAANDRIN